MSSVKASDAEIDYIWRHHKHELLENQCSTVLAKRIKAPLHVVWSLVRRFDQPQKYKPFVHHCLVHGGNTVGSTRDVTVKTGLPATISTEKLEVLDDEQHILCIRILGGDHRLKNYWSKTTLHPENIDSRSGTLVLESYVVDIPEGNTKDDTRYFVEALIRCNLKALADVAEKLAFQDHTELLDR